MPSFKDVYGSKWLTAGDVNGVTEPAKVLSIGETEVENDGGELRPRLYVSLQGWEKPLLLNATNAEAIGAVMGEDWSRWAGCAVVLSKVKVPFGNKRVDAIRIIDVQKPAVPT